MSNANALPVYLRCGFLALGLALLLTQRLAIADDTEAAVWAINTNGRLVRLLQGPDGDDFLSNTTTVVNEDANRLKSPRALAVRRDGSTAPRILVADTSGRKIVVYEDGEGLFEVIIDERAAGKGFRPDGIDVDSLGNLFGVNYKNVPDVFALVRDIACPNTLGCLGGGYRGPLRVVDAEVVIDGKRARSFADTRVARQALGCSDGSCAVRPGDLLVAVADPAAVIVFRRQSEGPDLRDVLAGTAPALGIEPEVLIGPAAFGWHAEPTGIAVGPDGNFLISTVRGDVLRFTPGGTRLADFTSGHRHGLLKLVVGPAPTGIEGALEFNAYVAQRSGGTLLRFLIEPDGTGTLNGSATAGVEHPYDLALAAGGVIPVAAGAANTALPLTSLLLAEVEQFRAGGQVSATSVLAVDPRPPICSEDEEGENHGEGCVTQSFCREHPEDEDCSVSLADLVPGARERTIPWNIRAADIGGVPTFVVVFADDDTGPFGVIQYAGDGEQAGIMLSCDDPDPARQPQIAWAPDDDDVQLIEPDRDRFINSSSDCGSSRGAGRDFSIFLFDVMDLLHPMEIADTELGNLDTILHLEGSSCIDSMPFPSGEIGVLPRLRIFVDTAQSFVAEANFACARDEMLDFDAFAADRVGAFEACLDDEAEDFDANFANVFGDLRSRAQRTSYQLGRVVGDSPCIPTPHDGY